MKLSGTFDFDKATADGTVEITEEHVIVTGSGFEANAGTWFDIRYRYESDQWRELTIAGYTTADENGVAKGELPRKILDFPLVGVTATITDVQP